MLQFFLVVSGIIIFLGLFSHYVFKKTKFGFFITMGEFGAGKTQNTTAFLKGSKYGKEVNITNYYTGYTNFQVSSHRDLINILNDIYDYHQYINIFSDTYNLYIHKKSHLFKYLQGFRDFVKNNDFPQEIIDSSEKFLKWGNGDPEKYYSQLRGFITKIESLGLYKKFKKGLKFNIVLDESSIYFNPRNFKKNFGGENEKLLDFIYQPRKLNLLMFCVVQSPMELDVKFRRLATYYRKYYPGLRFYRWYKDFFFLDPEEIDLEKAEQVGGGVLMGMNLNFYPVFPRYDYNTKELIRPGEDIYIKGSLYKYINEISNIPIKKSLGKKILTTLKI